MFARIVVTTLFTVLVGYSSAQVQVILPARSIRARESIEARVLNSSNRPVTYCVQIGRYSPKGDTIERTPIPFYVQKRSGDQWNTLMIGPDIGSLLTVVVLDPGKAHEFPFRIADTGTIRLVLEYWLGDRKNMSCPGPTKGKKTARSKVLLISPG